MPHVPMSAATIISEEVNALITAQDDALLANQMLFVSIIKTARNARVAFKDEQQMFATLHASSTKMLETRWAIGNSLKMVRNLAVRCGAAEVMEGCSGPCPASAMIGDEPNDGPSHALAAMNTARIDA